MKIYRKKSKFGYNRAKILGTLQKGQVLFIGDGDVESPYKRCLLLELCQNFSLFICPICISVVSIRPINVKFGVGGTFMKICRDIPNLVNRTYVSGTVHDDVTYATLFRATT